MRNTPMLVLRESVRKASAEMLEARILFTEFAVLRQRFNAIPGDDLVIIENEGPSTTGPTTIVVPHQGRLLNDADVPDTVYSIPHALNVQAGDVNGDGLADLIVTRDAATGQASGQRQISVLLNDGSGNFPNGPGQPLYNNDKATGDIVAIGDVNGDGATDLVVTTAGSPNTFHVLFGGKRGNGGGGGGGGSGGIIGANFALPQGASIVALADLDGDGKLDCVYSVSPPGSTGISLAGVALGDGNGGFAPRRRFRRRPKTSPRCSSARSNPAARRHRSAWSRAPSTAAASTCRK